MKLLLLCMNYAPEKTGIAPFTTGLSQELARRGHQVTVATTFPHYPEWSTQEPYRGKWFLTETMQGVTVRRTRVFLPRGTGAAERVLYDTSLSIGHFLSGLSVRDVDLILAVEPPIQAGAIGRVLGLLRRVPYAIWVHDLALEAALAVGMMRTSPVMSLAQKLEDWAHANASKIFVISQGFLQNLERKGIPASILQYLPNWADDYAGEIKPDGTAFRRTHGVCDEAVLVLHSGNMGVKQQLENVLDAAARIDAATGIRFMLVGDGSRKQELIEYAQRAGAANVLFLPLQPDDVVPQMMAAADILLVNQHADMVEAVMPSKLLTYMAAERPVVIAAHPDSEPAREVRDGECGVVVAPDQPDVLAQAILELAREPARRARLGQRGRAFVQENFARTRLMDVFEAQLREQIPDSAPARSWQRGVKRALDFAGALAALTLLSPLLLLIAVLIRTMSPGPALYHWRVVGQGGRPFTGYKFRTMVENADQLKAELLGQNEMQGPVFKMQNDPRATPIGRILRKFSLDELPQLWSVLKGDMSLVGPRPPLQSEYVYFTEAQKAKLAVKPGLTCLWQISGRNEIRDLDDWVRLDLEYIQAWSLGLDFKILLLTIPSILKGTGR